MRPFLVPDQRGYLDAACKNAVTSRSVVINEQISLIKLSSGFGRSANGSVSTLHS